jgi:hypothetical protein
MRISLPKHLIIKNRILRNSILNKKKKLKRRILSGAGVMINKKIHKNTKMIIHKI